jgi:predicted unusual protein kinase regulating ubiquinone biosynthesis (AarF/ABC1/UbiB family)
MLDEPKPAAKAMKTGAFARGLSLARMSMSAGMRTARYGVGSWFGDEAGRPERLSTLLTQHAEAVTRELGLLKGSVMKVGQMLSMVGDGMLPPQAVAVLRTLQSQAPPLPWPAIEAVLRAELGAEALSTLEIDPVAVASASLGQVHRAIRRHDGAVLALKVQYPGVDRSIDSDLRVLRRLLAMARLLPGEARFDGIFAEVREMLLQELDYVRELELTERHGALVGSDPRYIVPRTYPELSTARVLATSFETGLAVDGPEVAAFSQERRDAIGQAALEFTLNELTRWRQVQTDPHFGNYRIRPRSSPPPPRPSGAEARGEELDRIVMLDFGAVRTFEAAFVDRYLEMARGALRQERAMFERGALALGLMLPDDTAPVRTALFELGLIIAEPLGPPTSDSGARFTPTGGYRWGTSDLPRRALRKGGELALMAKLRSPPREMVFLDRKLGGTFFMLSALKSELQIRPTVEGFL